MRCRGCDRAFTKYGVGAASLLNPKLCVDCSVIETSYHGYHSQGMKCFDEFMTHPRGGKSHMKLEESNGRAS